MTSIDPQEPPTSSPSPRRFLRAHDDRVLGGVAGGLGRTFGVDPIIFRIALAALVFAGGVGLFVYVAAVLFVPADDGTGNPAPRRFVPRFATRLAAGRPPLVRLLALSGVGLAVLVGAGLVFWGAAWATAAGGGVAVAAIVLALGVVLVVGAFRGDRRVRWLVLPALLIAFPAGVVSAADISLDGGVGEQTYRPTGADRLPAGYRIGAGELVVDLRGLDWSDGRRVSLDLDVGVGHALVLVPDSVCVGARSAISVGYADVLGRDAGGVDVVHDVRREPAAGVPGLALDVHLGMGAFEVLHEDSHRERQADTESTELADRACAGGRA